MKEYSENIENQKEKEKPCSQTQVPNNSHYYHLLYAIMVYFLPVTKHF